MEHPGELKTEMPFTLPKGYLDNVGVLHRHGVMRLATAADEILPLRDPRVQQNEAYIAVIILARVITNLGDLPNVDTRVVEGLFASDFDYLQRLYEKLNSSEGSVDDGIQDSIAALDRASTAVRRFRTVGEA